MTNKIPPLPWLRAFEAAARHSSFAAAAKEIHLTPAAISHQVRSLEAQLGFKMFERLPRGLQLTSVGKAYLPVLRKAFDDIAISTIGLFGSDATRVLTVRVSTSFAALCLAPLLPDFKRQYPHIDVRLYTAIWADSPENDDADIEIRYGDGKWDGWFAERLTRDPSIIVSHQPKPKGQSNSDYLIEQAKNGVIQIMGCEGLWTQLMRANCSADHPIHTSIITDNSLTALELAATGMGATLVSQRFAQRYLETGTLVEPVKIALAVEQDHYVLTPMEKPAKQTESLLFKAWLLEQLSANIKAT